MRSRGGVVSRTITIATARVLIARNLQYNLGHVKIDSSWAQSLFRRMGFKRRMRTTEKVEIPEGARKEAELLYLHDIVSNVEKHDIPSHLVMNLGQTSLKYVPGMNHTMAKKNSSSVPIIGSSDKRSITGTFIVTLDEQFIPIQLIYGEKLLKSLPNFEFPDSLSLSVNPKHFSNTEESIKVVTEIVVPYVKNQRKELQKPDQAALLILDVFRGQITEDVTSLLQKHNILLVLVPNNMTHMFQPLDLTVNKHCKTFLKNLFSEWYSRQIENELPLGKKIEDFNIQFRLTTLKPLHGKWLLECYNHITSETGAEIILNGWKAAGIYDALKMGAAALPSLDPFQDISPLPGNDDDDTRGISDIVNVPVEVKEGFVNPIVDDDDDEDNDEFYVREEEDDDDVEFRRNAFDVIIDDEE